MVTKIMYGHYITQVIINEMEDVILIFLAGREWPPCLLPTGTSWKNSIMLSLNLGNP